MIYLFVFGMIFTLFLWVIDTKSSIRNKNKNYYKMILISTFVVFVVFIMKCLGF